MIGKLRPLLLSATRIGLPMYEARGPSYVSLYQFQFFLYICTFPGKRPSRGKRKNEDKLEEKPAPKLKKRKITVAPSLPVDATIIDIDDEEILPQVQGFLPTTSSVVSESTSTGQSTSPPVSNPPSSPQGSASPIRSATTVVASSVEPPATTSSLLDTRPIQQPPVVERISSNPSQPHMEETTVATSSDTEETARAISSEVEEIIAVTSSDAEDSETIAATSNKANMVTRWSRRQAQVCTMPLSLENHLTRSIFLATGQYTVCIDTLAALLANQFL
jgi:hypothetical protein